MDEPRDDIDTWLEERVTPLHPRPGAFEQISKRARRRKLGRTALAAAGAVVVVAGAVTVPRLVLNQASGPPVAAGGTPTPVHPVPRRPGRSSSPELSTSRGKLIATSATPTPGPPAAPVNFQPTSVTFVSASIGWILGQAGYPGHCGPPDPYICTSVAATDDAGASWHGVPAPVTGPPSGATGVSQIRSLNGASGWAFGPQLYATHDSGQTWTQIATHGLRVTDLETVHGRAFAIWASCAATGPGFAASCTRFSLYSAAAGSDAWAPVPGVTGLRAGAGAAVPAAAQLVLTNSRGYVAAPDGELITGPAASATHWRPVATAGIPDKLPCAPGSPGLNGQSTQGMLATTGNELVMLCPGPAAGGRQVKVIYYSANGGHSWQPAGTAPARGTATSLSGTPNGPILVATTGGIEVSGTTPGLGPLGWIRVRGAALAGGFTFVGMTTTLQGVAIPANTSQHAVWFTYDGGRHWQPSTVP